MVIVEFCVTNFFFTWLNIPKVKRKSCWKKAVKELQPQFCNIIKHNAEHNAVREIASYLLQKIFISKKKDSVLSAWDFFNPFPLLIFIILDLNLLHS